MSVKVLPGTPPLAIQLRRSARARRITIRVSGIDNRVTLTLPKRASEREAMAFALEKESWIRKHIESRGALERVGLGTRLPFEGKELLIGAGAGGRLRVEDAQLLVPGPEDRVAARVLGFVKDRARARCLEAADRYAAALGRPYAGLRLRDTRSRWGSCSSEGRIMLSWRLVLAPREILDYVVAHEVAHLEEMNHSPAFWDVVAEIHGPYAAPRRWLREKGADLHKFRFVD